MFGTATYALAIGLVLLAAPWRTISRVYYGLSLLFFVIFFQLSPLREYGQELSGDGATMAFFTLPVWLAIGLGLTVHRISRPNDSGPPSSRPDVDPQVD